MSHLWSVTICYALLTLSSVVGFAQMFTVLAILIRRGQLLASFKNLFVVPHPMYFLTYTFGMSLLFFISALLTSHVLMYAMIHLPIIFDPNHRTKNNSETETEEETEEEAEEEAEEEKDDIRDPVTFDPASMVSSANYFNAWRLLFDSQTHLPHENLHFDPLLMRKVNSLLTMGLGNGQERSNSLYGISRIMKKVDNDVFPMHVAIFMVQFVKHKPFLFSNNETCELLAVFLLCKRFNIPYFDLYPPGSDKDKIAFYLKIMMGVVGNFRPLMLYLTNKL